MTLTQLRAELVKVDEALSGLSANGQSYTIVGSHSVSSANRTDLEAQRQSLIRRILRKMGCSGRVKPDFGG